jgi:outer membrane protein assembly factor BamA
MRALACAIGAALALAPGPALSLGEAITDVRVRENARTDEETIRSIAGVRIGDTLEVHTLEQVRERLNTSGLFADVNVYWEPHRDGVRVNIVVKDKFPWAPVPTFSYSPGNTSGGLLLAHGNLFGRGKRGLIGGRLSTADSGAIAAYQDPALFGSWLFFQMAGRVQDQVIPELSNVPGMAVRPVRQTQLRSFGAGAQLGIAWFRRVKTSVGWSLDQYSLLWSRSNPDVFGTEDALPPATGDGRRAILELGLTFDFRAREHAVMWGNQLHFGLDHGDPRWGGDPQFKYWKAQASYEHGFRLFRRHNLVVRVGGFVGKDLPLWSENWAGAANLRGFVYRQFAGDTHARSQVEYHFPMFSISKLDVRGLVFHDAAAIWFRQLPPTDASGQVYLPRDDGRSFLPPAYLTGSHTVPRQDDIHQSVGAGLRFFLRTVAAPLVGVDLGFGFPRGPLRVVLVIGA